MTSSHVVWMLTEDGYFIMNTLTLPPQSALEHRLLAVDAYPFAVPNEKFRIHYDNPVSSAARRLVQEAALPLSDYVSLISKRDSDPPAFRDFESLFKLYPPRNAPSKAQQVLGFLVTQELPKEIVIPISKRGVLGEQDVIDIKEVQQRLAEESPAVVPEPLERQERLQAFDKADVTDPRQRHALQPQPHRRPTHKRSTSWPNESPNERGPRRPAGRRRQTSSPSRSVNSTQSETFLLIGQGEDEDDYTEATTELERRLSTKSTATRTLSLSQLDDILANASNGEEELNAAIDYMCSFEEDDSLDGIDAIAEAMKTIDKAAPEQEAPGPQAKTTGLRIPAGARREVAMIGSRDVQVSAPPTREQMLAAKRRSQSVGDNSQELQQFRNFARPLPPPPQPPMTRAGTAPSAWKMSGLGGPRNARAERPLSTIIEGDASSTMEMPFDGKPALTFEDGEVRKRVLASRLAFRLGIHSKGKSGNEEEDKFAPSVRWSPHLTPDKYDRRRAAGERGKGLNILCG